MYRLKERYIKEIVPALMSEFKYKNVMQVPRLNKIVVNIGLGEALQNPRALETAAQDVSTITGQKPIVNRSKKSIAQFKLRKGMAVGMSVTLRGQRMYHFFDKLVSTTLARIRDFRGVSADSFDGCGNYSLGLKDQTVFPEIEYDKVDKVRGLQINVITTAKNDEEGKRFLEMMGMPFKRIA